MVICPKEPPVFLPRDIYARRLALRGRRGEERRAFHRCKGKGNSHAGKAACLLSWDVSLFRMYVGESEMEEEGFLVNKNCAYSCECGLLLLASFNITRLL